MFTGATTYSNSTAFLKGGDSRDKNFFEKEEIDYYPFGMLMPNRNGQDDEYRYGFQGQEMDDEVRGTKGASYDFGARILDVRIGRWLSVDPMEAKYSEHSPYNFALNNPVYLIDPEGDTVTIHVTAVVVGTTKINLFSSGEVKTKKDKNGKVIKKGVKQKTKTVNVYRVDVNNESGSTATFYFTRISYRGDKDDIKAEPSDVTFDPETDGEMFLAKYGSRWGKTHNVVEVTPLSGKRKDGYDSYRGLADDREITNRKYIQFHVKGASDGCLLAVGSGQFTTITGTIVNTDLKSNSGETMNLFVKKLKAMQKEDKKWNCSNTLVVTFDQLKKPVTVTPAATTATAETASSTATTSSNSAPVNNTPTDDGSRYTADYFKGMVKQ